MLLKVKLPIVLMLIFACAVVHAQDFPLWEQLLKRYGGETDATSVPSMKMGGHMQMSLKAQSKAGDENRASDIVVRARRVLEHYANVDAAVRDGYKPFHLS